MSSTDLVNFINEYEWVLGLDTFKCLDDLSGQSSV